MHFGVLNYEKQHKEGTCKVLGRSVVFSAFYADFCLCPKLLIITTLKHGRDATAADTTVEMMSLREMDPQSKLLIAERRRQR